ncbi:hypothetical protein LshimejAT787_0606320 [Lyophyllum shimeji]|uniref:Uncharacterized protein n=1 Tax=Lyophyllum shimeji TaxID=47721 RepID=A0A9P3PP51_LYOSH|nr:hypothetical protein LshimejAT787_0606320 [Lyophyllum shimeji]
MISCGMRSVDMAGWPKAGADARPVGLVVKLWFPSEDDRSIDSDSTCPSDDKHWSFAWEPLTRRPKRGGLRCSLLEENKERYNHNESLVARDVLWDLSKTSVVRKRTFESSRLGIAGFHGTIGQDVLWKARYLSVVCSIC